MGTEQSKENQQGEESIPASQNKSNTNKKSKPKKNEKPAQPIQQNIPGEQTQQQQQLVQQEILQNLIEEKPKEEPPKEEKPKPKPIYQLIDEEEKASIHKIFNQESYLFFQKEKVQRSFLRLAWCSWANMISTYDMQTKATWTAFQGSQLIGPYSNLFVLWGGILKSSSL